METRKPSPVLNYLREVDDSYFRIICVHSACVCMCVTNLSTAQTGGLIVTKEKNNTSIIPKGQVFIMKSFEAFYLLWNDDTTILK